MASHERTPPRSGRGRFVAQGRRGQGLLAGLILAVQAATSLAGAAAPTGREIMQRVNDRNDGDNQVADMVMLLVDRKGNERKREVRRSRKDFGKDTDTILFFLSPADVKDTGFLTYDYDQAGKDDDQWLYLPALRKTKRIASNDESGSFMGSDFNYSDMTKPDLDDYTFTLNREVEVDGVKTWEIEAVPKMESTAEDIGYDKSVLLVRQDNDVVIRAVRWVHKSRQRKFMKVDELKQIDGIWVATRMQMVTKEGDDTVHATHLQLNYVRFNQKLSDDLFTLRALEKGP